MASPSSTSAYAAKLTGKRILVTGGTGYIGSHTVVELVQAGAHVVIIDNLCNSHLESLNRIKTITGALVEFHKIDLRDYDALDALLASTATFDACIHFAGLKAVGESVTIPLKYYEYNVTGAINLFRALEKYKCKNLVFSSSATVYGMGAQSPIVESSPLSTTNPYGQTKLVIEGMLQDIARAPVPAGEKPWSIALLRYFNPIGAHKSGLIGEDPRGIPNNLLPYVMQVAVGRLQHVNVFGTDYPTPDGTGVRDYIHVVDLARGHLAALAEGVLGTMQSACEAFNLGTGKGSSVLDVVHAAEKAVGRKLPVVMGPRRAGDVATSFSDPSKAAEQLKWKADYGLEESVADSWKWQSENPNGFAPASSV